jgi:hypothetical protein
MPEGKRRRSRRGAKPRMLTPVEREELRKLEMLTPFEVEELRRVGKEQSAFFMRAFADPKNRMLNRERS